MEKLAAVFFTVFLMLLFLSRGTPDGSYRPTIEVLRDPGGLLTLADVVAKADSPDFEKVKGHGFVGGYSEDTFWFKAEIEPFVEPIQQFFLEIQPAYLNEIEVFIPDNRGGYQNFLVGNALPFSERVIAYRSPIVTFPNPAEKFTAYIRLKTESASVIFLTAWTPAAFYEASLLEYIVIGAYIGVLLMFVYANMTRRQWLMKSGLIYYVLFVGGIMLVTLSSSGVLGQYVWPDHPWMSNVMIPVSTIVMLSTATLFYGYLFGIDNNESTLLKNIRYIIMGLIAAGLVAIAMRQYAQFMPLFSIVVAVIAIWLALRSISMLRNHAEEAKWLLAGWAFSLTGFIITGLTTNGILPGYTSLLYAYNLTTIAAIFNYQILMNVRITRLERTRQEAQVESNYLSKKLANERDVSEQQSRFLAMIHHELRTPLSVIRLALGMKNASPKVKSHASEAVRNIDTILERCALGQRLEHAQIEPRYQEIDIYAFLEKELTKMPDHPRLHLAASLTSVRSVVKTDPDLLLILLKNVLENALKYAVEGSMIEIELASQCELFQFCITIGNELEHPEEINTDKIFERYIRTPSAAKFSGSGLGLYIAKGLVDSLRGEISCVVEDRKIKFKICL